MGTDEQAIRELHRGWMAAVNAGELDRLLGMMTHDVVFIGRGREPVGREGFAATFAGAHRRAKIFCESELLEVVVVGELAYAYSRDSLEVTSHDRGAEVTGLSGYRLTIYRKQPDGRWLLARDAHTL